MATPDTVGSAARLREALDAWERNGAPNRRSLAAFGIVPALAATSPATGREPSGPCIECGWYRGIWPEDSTAAGDAAERHNRHKMTATSPATGLDVERLTEALYRIHSWAVETAKSEAAAIAAEYALLTESEAK